MQINDFNATGFDSIIEPSMIAKIANQSGASPTPAPTPETFEVEIISTGDGSGTCNKTYAEIVSAINQGKQLTGTVTINIPDVATLNPNIAYAYITDVAYGYPGGTETFNDAIYFTTEVMPPVTGISSRSMIVHGIILPETWQGAEMFMFTAQISN